MYNPVKITVQVPHATKPDRYFTFPVKQEITNEPAEYRKSGRLLAVSDIEGSFRAFCRILYKNGVINKYLKWTFEDNHLVIVGDCFDRGEQVIECLWLIYSLEEKARREGGYVHFILGNHEIMNLNGDWRYVHPKYAENTHSKTSRTALYGGNNELWRWIQTKNIIEKIGDILFVHAGITPQLLNHDLSITDINRKARPYYSRAGESFADPFLQTVFNKDTSPFWYRGYYQGLVTEEMIDTTLAKFDVSTIVTGHTIVEHVSSYYNGKVINVNTDHASGNSEALLIRENRFYRINLAGKKERIK